MKRKLLLLFLCLFAVTLCLIACDPVHSHRYSGFKYDDTHHWIECEESGCPDKIKDRAEHLYVDGMCVCGKPEPHSHNLNYVKAEPATCTENGHVEYWECTECLNKYSDEQGTVLITDITVPAGHKPDNAVRENEIPATCCQDGSYEEVIKCSVCKEELSRTPKTSPKIDHRYTTKYDETNHWLECEIEGCTVKIKETAEHVYVDGVCVCGKEEPRELEYKLDGNAYQVIGIGNVTDENLIIPSEYMGKPVTSVAQRAFEGNKSITSVTIPNSVNKIGVSAFKDCSVENLNKVYFTGSVAEWCNIVFSDLYSNPLSLCAELYISNQLVTELVIPDGVTAIKANAFYGCTSISGVTIGKDVASISATAYCGCNLTAITVDEHNTEYKSVDNCVMSKDGKTLVLGCGASIIPETTETVSQYAFYQCNNLMNVDIPSAVHTIERYAFYGCVNLKNVAMSNGIKTIGSRAFDNCVALEYNEYGNALYFGNTDNPYLALIKAKDKAVEEVTINENTKVIGSESFNGCKSLTKITIPESVTSICYYAFNNCNSLNAVYYTGTVESWLNIALDSVLSNPLRCAADLYLNGKLAETIDIPDTVTEVKDFAFSSCTSIKTVIIPDTVKSIGYSAFNNCVNLSSVNIPSNVQTIGKYAFSRCTLITSITIPSSVNSIAEGAFNGCTGLAELKFDGTQAQWNAITKGVDWNKDIPVEITFLK